MQPLKPWLLRYKKPRVAWRLVDQQRQERAFRQPQPQPPGQAQRQHRVPLAPELTEAQGGYPPQRPVSFPAPRAGANSKTPLALVGSVATGGESASGCRLSGWAL